jgi:glycosyltransferase involved in cell wall biosynthesis
MAVRNAASVIGQALAALMAQKPVNVLEVIVVDCSDDSTARLVETQFPEVCLLHFEQPMNLAQMRGRGIARAKGEIIAILDPYSIVDEDWLFELLRVHEERPNAIIGGAVELYAAEEQNLLTWAIYINEYGMFMLPLAAESREMLPGSNISYKRIALFDGGKPKYPEFWKTFVNWEVEQARSALWLAPSLVVRLHKPIPFGDFLRSRFDHGRCFASMRVAEARLHERLLRSSTTPFLPALFLWRWGRRYWAKRRYRAKLILTLPLQLLLFSHWSWGELAGYWRGPGQSCQRLFY